jgi:hypothetical protein
MKSWRVLVGIAILLVAAGNVQAQGHSAGVQVLGIPIVSVYKTTGGGSGYGYAPSAGYGYAAAPSYGYAAAPSYGYAAAPSYGYAPAANYGYAPTPSYGFAHAPSGCTGFSAGFSNSGYSAPAYGYGAPPAGYGTPQAGFVGGAIGILETLQVIKQIRDAVDQLRGGGGSSGGDSNVSADIKKLREDFAKLETKVNALDSVPPDVAKRLEATEQSLLSLKNVDLKAIEARIGKIEQNPKLKK